MEEHEEELAMTDMVEMTSVNTLKCICADHMCHVAEGECGKCDVPFEELLTLTGIDKHLGCPSYPNCDLGPMGCVHVMGDDVEWYGHRD